MCNVQQLESPLGVSGEWLFVIVSDCETNVRMAKPPFSSRNVPTGVELGGIGRGKHAFLWEPLGRPVQEEEAGLASRVAKRFAIMMGREGRTFFVSFLGWAPPAVSTVPPLTRFGRAKQRSFLPSDGALETERGEGGPGEPLPLLPLQYRPGAI